MIVDNLAYLNKYLSEHDNILIADFIQKVKSNNTVVGEWIFLNEELKALVLIKSAYAEGVFEAHTIYNDLHIVINGSDTIYLGDSTKAIIKSKYEENGDYTLYNSQILASVSINQDSFALISTGEIHSNHIDGSDSKKVVIKVKSNA